MGLTCQDAQGRGPGEGFTVSLAPLVPGQCQKLPSSLPGCPLWSGVPGFLALEPGLTGGIILDPI